MKLQSFIHQSVSKLLTRSGPSSLSTSSVALPAAPGAFDKGFLQALDPVSLVIASRACQLGGRWPEARYSTARVLRARTPSFNPLSSM